MKKMRNRKVIRMESKFRMGYSNSTESKIIVKIIIKEINNNNSYSKISTRLWKKRKLCFHSNSKKRGKDSRKKTF